MGADLWFVGLAIHELDQLARQALAVRQRRIAGHLGEHDCTVDDGRAPGAPCGIDCEDNHPRKANGLNVILAGTLRQPVRSVNR